MKRLLKLSGALSLFLMMVFVSNGYADNGGSYISTTWSNGCFKLSSARVSAPIYMSDSDYPGVIRAAKDLQADITSVTKAQPSFSTGNINSGSEVVLIGTIGKSKLIDDLIKSKKLNVDGIEGKWETYLLQVVENPYPGVKKALIIAGSDKRGTIFGIYDLSAKNWGFALVLVG